MSEVTENNNVYDFVAYRMQKIADDLAAKGQQDYADAMLEALQSYIEGEVEVRFIEGETYIVPKEDIVEATEKKNV